MVCRVCRHDMYNKPGYDEEKSCKYCAEPEIRKSFVEYYSYKWLPNGSKRTLQSPDIESLRRRNLIRLRKVHLIKRLNLGTFCLVLLLLF